MVSAIWSMPPYEASQMPLKFFINFFKNHGLFKLKNRPQWYTVAKRSKTYVNKIINQISGEYFKNYPINKIQRNTRGIKIFYGESDSALCSEGGSLLLEGEFLCEDCEN